MKEANRIEFKRELTDDYLRMIFTSVKPVFAIDKSNQVSNQADDKGGS